MVPCFYKITAHEEDVNSVAFADQTSNILISGSDDGLCKVIKHSLLFCDVSDMIFFSHSNCR